MKSNDATLLFYERRSPISIHHLAHATHEVLCTITGDSHMLNSAALTPEGKKEFKRIFNISKISLNTQTKITMLGLHLIQKQIYCYY